MAEKKKKFFERHNLVSTVSLLLLIVVPVIFFVVRLSIENVLSDATLFIRYVEQLFFPVLFYVSVIIGMIFSWINFIKSLYLGHSTNKIYPIVTFLVSIVVFFVVLLVTLSALAPVH